MSRDHFHLWPSWAGSLATITLTQVSTLFAALAGAATFGFTIHRWFHWARSKTSK